MRRQGEVESLQQELLVSVGLGVVSSRSRAHGNPGRKLRESFADGEPEANWIRSEERFTYVTDTYVTDEAEWLVRLPCRRAARWRRRPVLGAGPLL